MTALPQKCKRMSIYVGGQYRTGGLPLYEAIVMHAKKVGLAGVTVFTGLMSFGHLKMLEGTRMDGQKLSNELPVMIQIVETEDNINKVLPEFRHILGSHGLITLEDVDVIHQNS